MQVQRETVVRGPGTVKLGDVQLFDRDNIKADVEIETFDVPVSAYGNVDTRRSDITGAIAFRPSGRVTAAILNALYPHGTPVIGASLFGATDVATEIHSLAGTRVTFHSTALTGMPSLRLSSKETAFSGEARITALVKNNTARTADNSFYTVASASWTGAFDVADIKGGVYTGTWGTGVGAVTFQTAEGWTVDFEMATTPQQADGVGTYDVVLDGVTVRARCKPLNYTETSLLGAMNLQGATAVMGGSMRSGKDLVITAANALTVTLKEVALVEGPMEWGNDTLRNGEIGFVAHRAIASGVPGALFSVALAA